MVRQKHKFKDNSEYYIISKMFSGSYLEEQNIGHEIVNFFLDDEGENYIYVTKSGTINKECDDKAKAVVLARYRTEGCLEILGIAKIEKQLVRKSEKKSTEEQIDNYIRDVREKNAKALYYGGKDYQEIFCENIWRLDRNSKTKVQDNAHHLTFRTKEFLYPKETIFIYGKDYKKDVKNAEFKLADKGFGRQTHILYIGNKTQPDSFKKLSEIIADDKLWESDKNRKYPWQVDIASRGVADSDDLNWLHIMGRRDDELTFSNMLEYFLRINGEIKSRFCKKVLRINDIEISKDAKIDREQEGIDLCIRDNKNGAIIVIENKIKSGINGVSERHNYKNIDSQLSKYCRNIKKEIRSLKKKGYEYKDYYRILAPDYRKRDVNEESLSVFKFGDEYELVYYSQIYDFFKNEAQNYEGKDCERCEEFVKMLKMHAENYYNDAYIEMQRRFLSAIRRDV